MASDGMSVDEMREVLERSPKLLEMLKMYMGLDERQQGEVLPELLAILKGGVNR